MTFLGSTIGNFDPPGAAAFLHALRASLRAGDALLLGVDLLKPPPRLRLAYDDPLGVTAAFNRNLLVRINRELDAGIDIVGFEHGVVWNSAEGRIEMQLVARWAQHSHPERRHSHRFLGAGESIWTESSPGTILSK